MKIVKIPVTFHKHSKKLIPSATTISNQTQRHQKFKILSHFTTFVWYFEHTFLLISFPLISSKHKNTSFKIYTNHLKINKFLFQILNKIASICCWCISGDIRNNIRWNNKNKIIKIKHLSVIFARAVKSKNKIKYPSHISCSFAIK